MCRVLITIFLVYLAASMLGLPSPGHIAFLAGIAHGLLWYLMPVLKRIPPVARFFKKTTVKSARLIKGLLPNTGGKKRPAARPAQVVRPRPVAPPQQPVAYINNHHHYYGAMPQAAQFGAPFFAPPVPPPGYPAAPMGYPVPGQHGIPQYGVQQLRHNEIYDAEAVDIY